MSRTSWKTGSALACWSALFLSVLFVSAARAEAPTEDVRVRMNRVSNGVSLSGQSLRFPGRSPKAPQGFGYSAVKITWSTQAPDGLYEWTIEDRDTRAILARVKARALGLAGSRNRLNLRAVPDRLTIRPVSRRHADLIATLDLESYLRGVLPAEMPSTWPLESLKAQAVAARSFALWRKAERERAGAPYHLESTVMDQVFVMPLQAEESPAESAANVERAVRETRGIVLRDEDAEPLAAFFHADCGGRTVEPKSVWGFGKKNGVAVDQACPINPHARWRIDLGGAEITRAIRGPRAQVALASLEINDRQASGRVQNLGLRWSDGTTSQMSAHQFRMLIGHDRVKSTNFQLSKTAEGKFELAGQGYGHGVGMCQWGARHLALKGWAYREILKHYYPRATLIGAEAAVVAGLKQPEKL